MARGSAHPHLYPVAALLIRSNRRFFKYSSAAMQTKWIKTKLYTDAETLSLLTLIIHKECLSIWVIQMNQPL